MSSERTKILTRDVEASVVPVGTKVTLQKGETGAHHPVARRQLHRHRQRQHVPHRGQGRRRARPGSASRARRRRRAGGPVTQEQLEKQVWEALKTCYDPEIPVNIVDLGLIYDCHLTPVGENSFKADVKMTLTAPGCGMGPVLAQDVQNKLISLEPIDEANVELVWDPPWNQGMMTEAAKLQLGLM